MKKPHVIKERTKDEPIQGDLRGLGHDPLITDSEPFAFLTVCGLSHDVVRSLADAFKCTVHETKYHQTFWLKCNAQAIPHRKAQAIQLLGAGFVFNKKHDHAKLYLDEASGLHNAMENATHENKEHHHSPESMIKTWVQSPQTFSIGATTQLHLSQAGFHLSCQDELLHLTKGHIDQLFNEATSQTQQFQTATQGSQRRKAV